MADTVSREILQLPDFDDSEAAQAFVDQLMRIHTSHGVKKLLSHCEAILSYKERIADNLAAAERALLVVNGIRTPLQSIKDKARSYRATAEKFYSTLTQRELSILYTTIVGSKAPENKQYLVEALVKEYVESRCIENVM